MEPDYSGYVARVPKSRVALAVVSLSCVVTLSACGSDGDASVRNGPAGRPTTSATTSATTSPAVVDTPGDGISVSEGLESVSVSDDSSEGAAAVSLSPGATAPAACRGVAHDLSRLAPYLSANQPLTGARATMAHSQTVALRADAASGPPALSAAAGTLAAGVDRLTTAVSKHDTKTAFSIVSSGVLARPAEQIAHICGIKG